MADDVSRIITQLGATTEALVAVAESLQNKPLTAEELLAERLKQATLMRDRLAVEQNGSVAVQGVLKRIGADEQDMHDHEVEVARLGAQLKTLDKFIEQLGHAILPELETDRGVNR